MLSLADQHINCSFIVVLCFFFFFLHNQECYSHCGAGGGECVAGVGILGGPAEGASLDEGCQSESPKVSQPRVIPPASYRSIACQLKRAVLNPHADAAAAAAVTSQSWQPAQHGFGVEQ